MSKIAIAVKDNGIKVGHFGTSENFVVYNYDENTGDIEYDTIIISLKNRTKDSEEWEKSADAIDGCDIVICEQIGVVPKVNLKEHGVEVIEDSGSIEDVLDNFLKIKN